MAISPQRQARIHAMREHLNAHVLMLTEELGSLPIGWAGHPEYFKSIEDKICELLSMKEHSRPRTAFHREISIYTQKSGRLLAFPLPLQRLSRCCSIHHTHTAPQLRASQR